MVPCPRCGIPTASDLPDSPSFEEGGLAFTLHEHHRRTVEVRGECEVWRHPVRALEVRPGVWRTGVHAVGPGTYRYKFLLDGSQWLTDPLTPRRAANGFGGLDSLVRVP